MMCKIHIKVLVCVLKACWVVELKIMCC